MARQRLGSEPLVELHRLVVKPMATEQTRGAFYRGMRKVGIDGTVLDVPDCEACHGILKPDIVLFGETLPDEVFSEAASRAGKCDLFIVVGSSLVVYPAALMPAYAVDSGAELVIVNLSETPMDDRASILIRAKAGEAMTKIVQKLAAKING